jgi:hypothetical protein
MQISKKEQKKVLDILTSFKLKYVECPELGNENMPNGRFPSKMNWDLYPIYRVTFRKDGKFTRKQINKK